MNIRNRRVQQGLSALILGAMLANPTASLAQNSPAQAMRAVTSGEQLDFLDLEKLEEAKSLAAKDQNQEVLFLIMDIMREWRRVEAHNSRLEGIENMIREALVNASQGRFQTAEFLIQDVTNQINEDDSSVFSGELLNTINRSMDDLRRIIARETVRTGEQAFRHFHLEIPLRRVFSYQVETGILFWKSVETKERTVDSVEQLSVWVPETLTGEAYYDQSNASRFNHTSSVLTENDFKNQVNGLIRPYSSRIETTFSFNDYFGPGVLNGFSAFAQALVSPLTRSPIRQTVPSRWEVFSRDWFQHHATLQNGAVSISDRGIIRAPLLPKDKRAWRRSLQEKIFLVKSTLESMWANSENGYKFHIHSDSYDQFIGIYQEYKQLVNQVGDLWLNPEFVAKMTESFPQLVGNRPDSLERALVMAMNRSSGEVRELLAASMRFSPSQVERNPLLVSEYQSLSRVPAQGFPAAVMANGSNLFEDMVNLYMQGYPELVRQIFQKLSQSIQNKLNSMRSSIAQHETNVFDARNNSTSFDIASQLAQLDQAKAIIEQAQASAFTLDRIVTSEEYQTALTSGKVTSEHRRLYRSLPDVQKVQIDLRLAFGQAKDLINSVKEAYVTHPSQEVRAKLHEMMIFYHNRMNELENEYWPYKKFDENPTMALDANGNQIFRRVGETGEMVPVYVHNWTVATLDLFTDAQMAQYSISNVISKETVDLTYLRSHFAKMYSAMNQYAANLAVIYREFTEYPSHQVSVILKQALEDFSSLSREIEATMSNAPVASGFQALDELQTLKAEYIRLVQEITFVDENSVEGRTLEDLMIEIESLRADFNDLLINF